MGVVGGGKGGLQWHAGHAQDMWQKPFPTKGNTEDNDTCTNQAKAI
jgi:hypothetical protein